MQQQPRTGTSSTSTDTPRLADQVIRAGAIYSMAEDRAVYRAIALRNEWIVAVSGDPHGLDGLISSGTHVVDDPTFTLLPALVDQYTALWLYTAAGARFGGESHLRGTLQPHRLADLVAFPKDPVKCPVDDLLPLRPAFTVVGGRAVYDPERRLGAQVG